MTPRLTSLFRGVSPTREVYNGQVWRAGLAATEPAAANEKKQDSNATYLVHESASLKG